MDDKNDFKIKVPKCCGTCRDCTPNNPQAHINPTTAIKNWCIIKDCEVDYSDGTDCDDYDEA